MSDHSQQLSDAEAAHESYAASADGTADPVLAADSSLVRVASAHQWKSRQQLLILVNIVHLFLITLLFCIEFFDLSQ